MAVFTLHYGGQEYKLDGADAEKFAERVDAAFNSAGDIRFVEGKLLSGGTVRVAVSNTIPIAFGFPNPNPAKAKGGVY